jgi:hypothetical protein
MDPSQKARPPRVPYLEQVTICLGDDVRRCQAVNLSVTGILLLAPDCRLPEEAVRLSLPLSRPSPLHLLGVVVREATYCGHDAWGLQFQEATSTELEQLEAFVQGKLGGAGTAPPRAPDPVAEFDALPSTGELKRVYVDAIEEIHRQELLAARRKAEASKRGGWFRRSS